MDARAVTSGLRPWSVLLRWRTCTAAVGLFLIGGYATPPGLTGSAAAHGAVVVWTAVAQANVLNDIRDVAADRVDKPRRPIPAGAVPVGAAWGCFAVLVATGGVAAVRCGGPAPLWLLGWLVLSAVYNLRLKSTFLLGNVLVAALATSPLSMGAAVAGGIPAGVARAQLFTFAFMVSFEIVKTARDVEGDTEAGVSTVATRLGRRRALTLALWSFGGCAAAALAVTRSAVAPVLFAAVFLGGMAGPALGTLLVARRWANLGRPQLDRVMAGMNVALFFGLVSLIVAFYGVPL